MTLTVDIDTGGTFTDGFFAHEGDFRMVKVETTPHDLTVCFKNCVEEGARALGFDSPGEMLENAGAVKFSTTIATNTMIQKSGPKLGLMVTEGHEKDLYGSDGDGTLPLEELLPRSMTVGVAGGVGEDGEVVQPDLEEVRAAVRGLLTAGARSIIVCLKGAFSEPAPEQRVKEMILADYPRHYLGAVPVFLSSELCTRDGDHERVNATVVNTYLHRELARYLYKAEEDLRQSRLRKPLLIVHSTGGAARVAKTTALHTYNSGPVAGFLGSYRVGKLLGIDNIASVDMGGTSTDIGVIARDRYRWQFDPMVGNIPVNIPMIEIKAIGGGGGSIAKPDLEGKGVEVGPDSAGALPGPACYGLGGSEPTVTDADLVLGYINPDRFLGGRRKLDAEKSAEAIKEKIASPLGVSVLEAASLIKGRVDITVAAAIEREIADKGLDPDDFSLFIYGGAGPCHCCGFGERFPKLYVFPYSAVFSSFGASTLDVAHVYETVRSLELCDGTGAFLEDLERFNEPVCDMERTALRDMRGEGFDPESASLQLELEMGSGRPPDRFVVVRSPHLSLEGARDAEELCAAYRGEYELLTGEKPAEDQPVAVRAFRLTASCPVEHVEFQSLEFEGEDSSHAKKGIRPVSWGGPPLETAIYERGLLRCGNVVYGPAIIEQDDTTCVLPEGRALSVDRYLNGVIERA